ncbi:hypothetical protein UG54_17045 [Gordonia sihwensis]|nr:hypothetical protein UG54_17045 [Gordonia sihwensis]
MATVVQPRAGAVGMVIGPPGVGRRGDGLAGIRLTSTELDAPHRGSVPFPSPGAYDSRTTPRAANRGCRRRM